MSTHGVFDSTQVDLSNGTIYSGFWLIVAEPENPVQYTSTELYVKKQDFWPKLMEKWVQQHNHKVNCHNQPIHSLALGPGKHLQPFILR